MSIFFLLLFYWCICQKEVCHCNVLDRNYLSTNLQMCRWNLHGYPLMLYLQSQMVHLDTISLFLIQQMLNCEISLFRLSGHVPLCLKAHYPRQICDPPRAAIREHRVQPKLFLWEETTGSFSIQYVSSLHESPPHSTFLPVIPAEIHLAVRKTIALCKSQWLVQL